MTACDDNAKQFLHYVLVIIGYNSDQSLARPVYL